GRVAIGLPPSLARLIAVPLTRRFRQQLPQARLSITEGLSVSMQDALLNGRLDLALLYNAQPLPELELQPLFDEELMLVQAHPEAEPHAPSGATSPTLAPHPAPLPLAELAQLPLLIPTRPNALRMHVEVELAKLGLRPRIALEIDGVSAILDLVADGLGCAVLSRHAVAASGKPAAFAVRPIGPPALQIQVALASSAQRPTTLTQRAARELIRQVCQQSLGPLKPLPAAA
ncbi:MAG: LysR substrate-binding domain-containing protein, partial [Serpentinimonas sp.]|nr:LysR substrate-binding domain-containing protein [Serpentinimonas sp.]